MYVPIDRKVNEPLHHTGHRGPVMEISEDYARTISSENYDENLFSKERTTT